MSDGSIEKPISAELVTAFDSAVAAFDHWSYGEPEPNSISFDRGSFHLVQICDFVRNFSGIVPENAYREVRRLAADFRGGSEALHHNCDGPRDHTYASVAECLQRLYAARKAHFERLRVNL
jgi:hypothetical protein